MSGQVWLVVDDDQDSTVHRVFDNAAAAGAYVADRPYLTVEVWEVDSDYPGGAP